MGILYDTEAPSATGTNREVLERQERKSEAVFVLLCSCLGFHFVCLIVCLLACFVMFSFVG